MSDAFSCKPCWKDAWVLWPLPGRCNVVSIHFWFVARHLWMVPWGFWVDYWWLPPSSSLCYLYILLVPIFFTKGIIFISRLFFLGSNELKWTLDSNCVNFLLNLCPKILGENIWDDTWFPWREGTGAFPFKNCCIIVVDRCRVLLLYITNFSISLWNFLSLMSPSYQLFLLDWRLNGGQIDLFGGFLLFRLIEKHPSNLSRFSSSFREDLNSQQLSDVCLSPWGF